MIEYLHFDPDRGKRIGLQVFHAVVSGPNENARVATRFLELPLGDQLEVLERLLGADHTDRLARAVDSALFPGPGVLVAVDVGEVIAAKRSPPESLAVDEGLGMILRFVGWHQVCDDGQHADASKNKKRSERFHSSSSAGRFKSEPPK